SLSRSVRYLGEPSPNHACCHSPSVLDAYAPTPLRPRRTHIPRLAAGELPLLRLHHQAPSAGVPEADPERVLPRRRVAAGGAVPLRRPARGAVPGARVAAPRQGRPPARSLACGPCGAEIPLRWVEERSPCEGRQLGTWYCMRGT